MSGKVRVADLRVLRKAFRASGTKEFDKHLTKVHRKIARDLVNASRPGLAAVSSTTAGAVTVMTSATAAKIKVSREDAPMAAGVIFGAIRTKRRIAVRKSGRSYGYIGFRQFRQWSGEEPYHIWPEMRTMHDQVADGYIRSVDEFFGKQGVPPA